MRLIARMPAENLRQSMEVEDAGCLKHGFAQPVQMVMQSIARKAQGKRSLLDRPHGSAMIAVRIVSRMAAGQCSYSPAAEKLFRHEAVSHRDHHIALDRKSVV